MDRAGDESPPFVEDEAEQTTHFAEHVEVIEPAIHSEADEIDMHASPVSADSDDTDTPRDVAIGEQDTDYPEPEPGAHEDAAGEDDQGDAVAHVVEDDDILAMPAAPIEYLGHAPPPTKRKSIHLAQGKSLKFRQTIVPLLLTFGLMMVIFGLMKFFVGEDSPVLDLPGWVPIAAFAVALVMFALAVVNMLVIRQELMTEAANEAAVLA